MKTSCISCARRASVRCPSPPNIRRPAASLQRRLSGGETDPEGFIRPSYDAAGGASEAKRRGNFTSGTQTGHSRRGLILQCIEISNNLYPTDVSPQPYERAESTRKRTSAEGIGCARSGVHESSSERVISEIRGSPRPATGCSLSGCRFQRGKRSFYCTDFGSMAPATSST